MESRKVFWLIIISVKYHTTTCSKPFVSTEHYGQLIRSISETAGASKTDTNKQFHFPIDSSYFQKTNIALAAVGLLIIAGVIFFTSAN